MSPPHATPPLLPTSNTITSRQRLINASSMPHQCLVNASSMPHQCLIGPSPVPCRWSIGYFHVTITYPSRDRAASMVDRLLPAATCHRLSEMLSDLPAEIFAARFVRPVREAADRSARSQRAGGDASLREVSPWVCSHHAVSRGGTAPQSASHVLSLTAPQSAPHALSFTARGLPRGNSGGR